MRRMVLLAGVVIVTGLIAVRPVTARVGDILTHRYDNARSGVNLKETTLNKSNVKTNFGKLAFRNVDGNIYAQPLVVFQAGIVNCPNPTNVVIVATEHNSVFAFDADDLSPDAQPFEVTKKALWYRGPNSGPDGSPGLGPSIVSDGLAFRQREGDMGCLMVDGHCFSTCGDLTTEVGIASTPAIKLTNSTSPKQGIIFVVAKSFSGSQVTYTLFTLRLSDGKPIGDGVPIQGTVSGPSGTIKFDPLIQLNRSALLLDNNVHYMAFGGHCDRENYRGWVFAYDVTDPSAPKQLNVLSTTFTQRTENMEDKEGRGGIWMSGYGLATDGNAIYFSTGDGTYNVTNASFPELSNSVVKTKLVSGKIQLQDWFTPQNRDTLKTFDVDLGSAGPVLVPNSHLLIAAGKEGYIYLIDRNDMGRGTKPSLQSFQVTPKPQPNVAHPTMAGQINYSNIHGAPVIWPLQGQMFVYVMGEEDSLKQYRLVPDPGPAGWRFDSAIPKQSIETPGLPPPQVRNDLKRNQINMSDGFLTISASGTDPNTGIVWATMPYADNANMDVVRGVLRAFDASDVSKGELWDSERSGNDGLGVFAKYNPPLVANGRVYVAAFQQESMDNSSHIKATTDLQPALVIYGLKQ